MNLRQLQKLAGGVASLPTAPFHELAVFRFISGWARAHRFRVETDSLGNLLVGYKKGRVRERWAFAAHMDHPGFEVVEFAKDPRGRSATCEVEFLGGVSPEYFRPGTRIVYYTRAGAEVGRGALQGRLGKRGSKRFAAHFAGVAGGGQEPAYAMWDIRPVFRIAGGRIRSRVCDDLMGCVAIMGLFEELKRTRVEADVVGIFARAEEVGFVGAIGLARSHRLPKSRVIISVENSKALPDAKCGDGPVIRVGDRASVFDPGVTARMTGVAENLCKEDALFRYQRRLMYGGTCEATAYGEYGYRVGAVCLPMEHYHNMGEGGTIAAERVDLKDVNNLVKMMVAISTKPATNSRSLKKRLGELYAKNRRKLCRGNDEFQSS
ncbi:MAG: hypothetical protein SFY92_12775 [Verrucomicrobiae bacterium]|nr:hypothetical protein [Verrucomicrobiae bacterium]